MINYHLGLEREVVLKKFFKYLQENERDKLFLISFVSVLVGAFMMGYVVNAQITVYHDLGVVTLENVNKMVFVASLAGMVAAVFCALAILSLLTMLFTKSSKKL